MPAIAGIDDLFDQETADTFEAGVKAQFADSRVSTNAEPVFYTEAKGSYFFVFDPNTSTQNLGNLDEVEYMGLEAELQAQVTDGLDVYLRGGYTDSEIKEEHRTDGTGLPSDVGNQAPLVSEYTINLGALWRVPLGGSGWDFFIRAGLPDHRPDLVLPRQLHGAGHRRPAQPARRDRDGQLVAGRVVEEPDRRGLQCRVVAGAACSSRAPGYTNNFVFKAQPQVWGVDLTYRF